MTLLFISFLIYLVYNVNHALASSVEAMISSMKCDLRTQMPMCACGVGGKGYRQGMYDLEEADGV